MPFVRNFIFHTQGFCFNFLNFFSEINHIKERLIIYAIRVM